MLTTYRVIIDGIDTGNTVTGGSYADAYFDVASTVALTYQNEVVLEKVESAMSNIYQNQVK